MARIRTVKPEFFRHEGLQDLEIAHIGKYPMMVFIGLWGHCDNKGRFEWRPRQLKLDILPFIQFDMAETLEILEQAGFVKRYVVNGKVYGEIETFEKHQRITGKEALEGEKHPSPYVYDTGNTGETPGKQQGNTGETPVNQQGNIGERPDVQEGKGKEGKGKENIRTENLPPDGDVCASEHESLPAKEKPSKPLGVDDLVAAGVDRQVAADWLVLRKAKRLPLTKTALSDVESQAAIAGIGLADAVSVACSSGWAGFKASWYEGLKKGNVVSLDDTRTKQQRESDGMLAVAGTRNFV